MPRFVAAFLLITLSSIALPGMNGFVGEFLILLGTFQWSWKFAALAGTGVILSAVYMLWMFQRVNYGEITNEKNRALPDLSPREWALMVPTIAMAIVMGVFPGPFTRPMERSVNKVIERVTAPKTATLGAPGQLEGSGQHFLMRVGPHPHALSRGLRPLPAIEEGDGAGTVPISAQGQNQQGLRPDQRPRPEAAARRLGVGPPPRGLVFRATLRRDSAEALAEAKPASSEK